MTMLALLDRSTLKNSSINTFPFPQDTFQLLLPVFLLHPKTKIKARKSVICDLIVLEMLGLEFEELDVRELAFLVWSAFVSEGVQGRVQGRVGRIRRG
jgi:hypothetical protein